MSTKFDDFLNEQLNDVEIRSEYEALQPEHALIQAMIDAGQESGITQKELAKRTGIVQGDINKSESFVVQYLILKALCESLKLIHDIII